MTLQATISSYQASKEGAEVLKEGHMGEGIMEAAGAHDRKGSTEWTTEIRDYHVEEGPKSFNEVSKLEQTVAMVAQINGNNGARGCKKATKRNHAPNLQSWGVALRKPFRERRKVRSYSPSREWTVRKKARLGFEDSKVSDGKRIFCKQKEKKGRIPKNQDVENGGKRSNSPDKMTPKPDPESFSDDFKVFMTQEIKRQVLDGLGEADKQTLGDIQIVEVEEIRQCMLTASCTPGTKTEEQRYIAKVKLMATLFFPLTVQATQDSHKPMEHGEGETSMDCKDVEKLEEYVSKGREDAKDVCVMDKDVTKDRSMENREPKVEATKDTKEHEPMESQLKSAGFSDEPSSENEVTEEIDVPESEFYDFECDRNVDKFAPGQVWASYDCGKDVMPRDYVQIKKVLSINPFKVQIALLEPRGFHEWVEAGNSLTCGEYVIDDVPRLMHHINGFSHQMKWTKWHSGTIHIYPAEEEVWALYKNWREIDPKKRIKLGYEIVQVVTVKVGMEVSVVQLVKYKGSRTLFVRQEMEPIQIHKRDFNRFSHQIATFEIIGSEDLQGCIELDPAAIPSHWIDNDIVGSNQ